MQWIFFVINYINMNIFVVWAVGLEQNNFLKTSDLTLKLVIGIYQL